MRSSLAVVGVILLTLAADDQEEPRVQIGLDIGDVRAIVVAERTADHSRKTVTIQFDGQKPVEVLSVDEGPRFVSGTEFRSLMSPH